MLSRLWPVIDLQHQCVFCFVKSVGPELAKVPLANGKHMLFTCNSCEAMLQQWFLICPTGRIVSADVRLRTSVIQALLWFVCLSA